jgi:SAM-dependent methyltransferase
MKIIDNFYEYLTKEYNAHFSGWDFSYIKGRMVEDEISWNFRDIIEKNCIGKNTLLDMHTGGGEFLCSLSNLPENVYATESYEPNIPIAEKRLNENKFILKPVKKPNEISFDNEYFEVITNRHGSYDIQELKRALKNGGLFITQQVGGLNGIDINMSLETKTMDYVEWCLVKNIEMFQIFDMEIIEYGENIGKMKFYDMGAFVFYLKCIPWQVKDFTVEKYFKKLEIMSEIIIKNGFLEFISHRFYLIIKKP